MKRANALFLTRERRVNDAWMRKCGSEIGSLSYHAWIARASTFRHVSPGPKSRLGHSRGYALFFTRDFYPLWYPIYRNTPQVHDSRWVSFLNAISWSKIFFVLANWRHCFAQRKFIIDYECGAIVSVVWRDSSEKRQKNEENKFTLF